MMVLQQDQLAPVPLLSMVMKLLGQIQGVARLASLCNLACGLLLLPPARSGDLLPYTAILGSPGFPTTGDSATRFARTSGSIGGFRTIFSSGRNAIFASRCFASTSFVAYIRSTTIYGSETERGTYVGS